MGNEEKYVSIYVLREAGFLPTSNQSQSQSRTFILDSPGPCSLASKINSRVIDLLDIGPRGMVVFLPRC